MYDRVAILKGTYRRQVFDRMVQHIPMRYAVREEAIIIYFGSRWGYDGMPSPQINIHFTSFRYQVS